MRTSLFRLRRIKAFSLPEVVVAAAIGSVVVAGGLTMLMSLQRGFAFSTMWMDVRARQVRVLEAMAMDLRNATYVAPAAGSTGGQTLPLKLTVPKRYADYERSGWTAGDPLRTGSSASQFFDGISTTTGKPVFSASNTVLVKYEAVASGNAVTITRTISWTGGPTIAPRAIATFPNGVKIAFSNVNGAPFVATSTDTKTNSLIRVAVEATAEDSVGKRRGTLVSTSLADTVYLRMMSTISAKSRTAIY